MPAYPHDPRTRAARTGWCFAAAFTTVATLMVLALALLGDQPPKPPTDCRTGTPLYDRHGLRIVRIDLSDGFVGWYACRTARRTSRAMPILTSGDPLRSIHHPTARIHGVVRGRVVLVFQSPAGNFPRTQVAWVGLRRAEPHYVGLDGGRPQRPAVALTIDAVDFTPGGEIAILSRDRTGRQRIHVSYRDYPYLVTVALRTTDRIAPASFSVEARDLRWVQGGRRWHYPLQRSAYLHRDTVAAPRGPGGRPSSACPACRR